ncbi:hypothetical protein FB451DRAFT_1557977 [Mycena latifolia]|nr:hypothetical protein FB451DRAFT_1557977 [Mycena latifolia]
MSGTRRAPKSVVGKLYAEVEKWPAAVDLLSMPGLQALETEVFGLSNCPAHQLEPSFYRFRAYFHPDDLPPTGAHLHDVLSLKHAILALVGLTNVLGEARGHPSVLPRIVAAIRVAWPDIWHYIEVLERNYLLPNDAPIDGPGIHSQAIMHLVVPSLNQFMLEDDLADVVQDAAYAMFVRLWYRLGMDAACAEWPFDVCLAAVLHSIPLTSAEIVEKVILPLGGEGKVAKAAIAHLRIARHALERVRRNSSATQTEVDHAADITANVASLLAGLAMVPKMAYTLLANNAVRQMTRAFVSLTALPIGADTNLTGFLSFFALNISITDSIAWVIQALDAGILIGLLRYELLQNGDSYSDAEEPMHVELLAEILPRYLVFLSVVQAARRALKKAKRSGAERAISRSSDLWAAWVAFEDLVKKRVDVAGNFARQKNACNRCGQVERKRGSFRPCSGCSDLYYCSPECQKRDWEFQHRQYCKTMKQNRIAGWIVNSSPTDYAFVPVFIRQDFEALGVAELCRRDWGQNPPESPSIYIDYAAYPVSVETEESPLDFEGPSRRDVLCVHVMLPNEEVTWFALRSDNDDEEDRAKRVAVALASRGPVVAYASPGIECEGNWFGGDDSDDGNDSDWTDTDSDTDDYKIE